MAEMGRNTWSLNGPLGIGLFCGETAPEKEAIVVGNGSGTVETTAHRSGHSTDRVPVPILGKEIDSRSTV